MKKIYLLKTVFLLCALVAGSNVWAQDETIDFSSQGYSNQEEVTSVSGSSCTITFDKGTNSNTPKYFTTGTAIRAYGGNTITVSSTSMTISKIDITFGSGDGSNEITTDVDTYSDGTWSGEASDITFTIGGSSGHRRLQKIAVTYKSATPAPTHTVTWSVNGTTKTNDFSEGRAIVFPSNIDDVEGKSFVGWVNTEISGTTDEAPAFVTSATMGTSDVTYYAVFADKTPGTSTTVTDEINRELTGITSSSYSNWSGKTSNSQAVYAGNSSGGSGTVQLRTTNSNSGIVTTTSGGKITKIAVTWANNTLSGRTLDIYGKNSAYEAASDLYNTSKQGTKLGSIVCETSTELTVDGDYTYIGLRSNNSAMYLSKISITWVSETPDTYSGYCTTVTIPTATITLNAACTDGKLVYGTYSNSSAFVVSDEIEVSEISIMDGKLYVEAYKTGDVVPANTGVMVSAMEGGDYTVNLSSETGTSVLGEDNMLRPTGEGITAEQMAAKDANCQYYRLTMQNGETIGFWWGAEDGAAFAVDANKAYLAVPETEGARMSFWMGNESSGIADALIAMKGSDRVVYDLQGRRVKNVAKGLYIVDGKKVLVK